MIETKTERTEEALPSSVEFRNIESIEAFIRNLGETIATSDSYAAKFAEELEAIIRSRVSQGIYLGGMWDTKPYSDNPIKAYKLGTVIVSGQGMNKELSINGKVIDRSDWFWGTWDREKHGVTLSGASSGEVFDDWSGTGKPAPVFIPGYLGWRVQYNGLSPTVDLNFTGNMLDDFGAEISRTRGSNQFGGKYYIDFTSEGFQNRANITDYYREWMSVTEDEVRDAIERSGADIANLVLF